MAAVLSIIIFLVLGTIIFSALGNQNTLEPSLAEQHLDNFDLLINLSLAGKNSLEAAQAERGNNCYSTIQSHHPRDL